MQNLDMLTAQTRPVLLHLLDNAIHPTLLQTLPKQQTPIPWYGFARITEILADREFCHALRCSGCIMLKLGIESGNQDVLDRMNKAR